MKYKCLVLDHDDTVMNSTATVHYPAFLAYMKERRPHLAISLEQYFLYNFEPGVVPFFRDICGLSEAEMREEEAFWADYVQDHIPPVFPGIRGILTRHRQEGGIICVISHSFERYILRDYEKRNLPKPDRVFGWDLKPELRKPDPYALFQIMKTFHLSPEQLLVVDDLKPGYDMAKAANVPFAAAGWANDVPQIEAFMRKNCDYYFKTVGELETFLFS